jgi:hypothetical protein
VTGFFLRLTLWQLRGRVIRTARLARKPKYAVGLGFGLLYFGWLFVRPFAFGDSDVEMGGFSEFPDAARTGFHALFSLAAAVYVCVSWLVMPGKDSLKLRSAELHLLLPAPVSPRQVNLYALLRSLPAIVLTGLLIGFFASGGSLENRLVSGAFLVLMFLLWDLHAKGRNLYKARLASMPPQQALPRRILVLGLAVAFLVLVGREVFDLVQVWRGALAEAADFEAGIESAFEAMAAYAADSRLRTLLTPFLWITGGRLFEDPLYRAASWLLAVALSGILGAWVINQRVRFDESALKEEQGAQGKKRRRYEKMSERARRRVPFRLKPSGWPETALLWKDLLVLSRWPAPLVALAALAALAVVAGGIAALGSPPGVVVPVATVGAIAAGWIAFLTGILWPNAFHRDLHHLELLRTWPVPGRRLVFGASLSAVAQALAVALLGAGLVFAADAGCRLAVLLGDAGMPALLPPDQVEAVGVPAGLLLPLLVVSLLPVTVGIAFVSSALETLTAMLFPGWLLMAERQKGDPAAIGQKILYGFGFMIAMAIGLVPGAVMVGLVLLAQHFLGLTPTPWQLLPMSLVAAAPLVLEGLGLIWLAGRLWDRMDASEEILEGLA